MINQARSWSFKMDIRLVKLGSIHVFSLIKAPCKSGILWAKPSRLVELSIFLSEIFVFYFGYTELHLLYIFKAILVDIHGVLKWYISMGIMCLTTLSMSGISTTKFVQCHQTSYTQAFFFHLAYVFNSFCVVPLLDFF